MKKRLIFVFGAESSGGRLVKKILLQSGCDGDRADFQKWDEEPPTDEPLVVWHRSFPYSRKNIWTDICSLAWKMRGRGYDISAVVTTRDWFPMTYSVKHNHTISFDPAVARTRKAHGMIFSGLFDANVPYYTVSYEALVQRPKEVITWLCQELELPMSQFNHKKIMDGNAKYYNEFQKRLSQWKIKRRLPQRKKKVQAQK